MLSQNERQAPLPNPRVVYWNRIIHAPVYKSPYAVMMGFVTKL